MVLEQNIFVEQLLPRQVLRTLGDEEIMEYRRPFAGRAKVGDQTLTWPRQVPIDGIHFLQEGSSDEIGRAVAEWVRGLA